jgi:hypothetical protein
VSKGRSGRERVRRENGKEWEREGKNVEIGCGEKECGWRMDR